MRPKVRHEASTPSVDTSRTPLAAMSPAVSANQLAWEVEQLVLAGMEPWEALGAATWRGGELLGEPDAGVIREGGPADLVLVHGDPVSDPAALWRAWHVSWQV